jgi:hypothetical protein
VYPHPVTTTLVPAATVPLSKTMGCATLLYTKAGLTCNIAFQIQQNSMNFAVFENFFKAWTLNFKI